MDPLRTLGGYRIVGELGQGGMGVVYEVEHPEFSGRRALKLIHVEKADEAALERFGREAQLLARVQHPGVVAVHELGRAAEGPFLVMERIEGETLKDRCRAGPLEPKAAAAIARAVADAVSAIHASGILHRDLKPENVMLRAPTDQPVLLDFGIARALDSKRLTQTGTVVGSPAYMSPEQADGMSPTALDARTDVYGVGAILFHTLAGGPPFDGGSMVVLKKVLVEEPLWPQGLPKDLELIGRKAMAKNRNYRYETVTGLRDDLDRYLRGETVHALAPPRKVRRLVIAASALGLAALLAFGVNLAIDRRPQAPPTKTTPLPPAEDRAPPRPLAPEAASPKPRCLLTHTTGAKTLPIVRGRFASDEQLVTVTSGLGETPRELAEQVEVRLWDLTETPEPKVIQSWPVPGTVDVFAVTKAPAPLVVIAMVHVADGRQEAFRLVPGKAAQSLFTAVFVADLLFAPDTTHLLMAQAPPPDRGHDLPHYLTLVTCEPGTDAVFEPIEGPGQVEAVAYRAGPPELIAAGQSTGTLSSKGFGASLFLRRSDSPAEPLVTATMGNVSAVTLSPDGRELIFGTTSHGLRSVSTDDLSQARAFTPTDGMMVVHKYAVTGLTFFREGHSTLISCAGIPLDGGKGYASELIEWDPASDEYEPLRRVTEFPYMIVGVAASPSGKRLALSALKTRRPQLEVWSEAFLEQIPKGEARTYAELVR